VNPAAAPQERKTQKKVSTFQKGGKNGSRLEREKSHEGFHATERGKKRILSIRSNSRTRSSVRGRGKGKRRGVYCRQGGGGRSRERRALIWDRKRSFAPKRN